MQDTDIQDWLSIILGVALQANTITMPGHCATRLTHSDVLSAITIALNTLAYGKTVNTFVHDSISFHRDTADRHQLR